MDLGLGVVYVFKSSALLKFKRLGRLHKLSFTLPCVCFNTVLKLGVFRIVCICKSHDVGYQKVIIVFIAAWYCSGTCMYHVFVACGIYMYVV